MSSKLEPDQNRPRPSNVPRGAGWFFDSEEWLYCERDEAGELHGPLRTYREDGTPWIEFEYRHGKRHGPFRRFYPSGELAQAGRYFDDLLDGLLIVHSDGADPYSIRECCISANARVMKQEHRRGQLLAEAFDDEHGRRLPDPEGSPGGSAFPEPLREREDDVLEFAYAFWPALEAPSFDADSNEVGEVCVEQPLNAVRAAIQRSFQRVQAFREELLSRSVEDVPPDLSASMPASALTLRRFEFEEHTDEGELTVSVDETPSFDRCTRALRARARREWTALCWLCWGVGLDAIALPARIELRSSLLAALVSSSEREAALAGHDLRPSEGRHFHGLDERVLPASAMARLADHYREIRAVLLFLTDAECQSPWQDDLGRGADTPEE